MRILIAGAGAVGGYLGACLAARTDHDVVLFARGPHYRAMKKDGVRILTGEDNFLAHPEVVDNLETAGVADVIVLAVKARSLPELVPRLKPSMGTETICVSTQNGIPWWYFQNYSGRLRDAYLESVDPGGRIASTIDPNRVIGGIVYFSSEIVEPGVIRLIAGNRISLGELDGSRSPRTRRIAAALVQAGLRAPITARIRHEIWVKLLGNMSLNPISALTGATVAGMLRDSDVSALVRDMMQEAAGVAAAVGIQLPVSIEQRMAGAGKVGEHRTSMLQDLEAGRPLEIGALVGAVLELGDRCGVDMPHTRAVYASAKLLAKTRNLV